MAAPQKRTLTVDQKNNLKAIFAEHDPKTDPTLYALNAVIENWVETEVLIERDAKAEIDKNLPKWTPENEEEYGEFCAERDQARMLHDQIMIPMHRYSCVVMLFTTIERELQRLIENLEKEHGHQKLKLKDISGGFLDKATKYLEAFYGLRLADCPQYTAVHDLQKIRDCIIHCLGDVGLSQDKNYLVRLTKIRKGFWAYPNNDIKIEPECIQKFLVEIWEFFVWVFQKLKWKIASYYQKNDLEKMFQKVNSSAC
jgi:hypothetical protein